MSESRSTPIAAAGGLACLLAVGALAGSVPGEPPGPVRRARAHPSSDAGTSAAAASLREGQPVDPNSLDSGELELLPGIGPTLGRRIVADRRERGPFESLDQLGRVPGIGPKTLERLAPLLEIRSDRDGGAAP